MNTYYEKNGSFDSNSRIFEGYFTEVVKPVSRVRKTLDSFLYIMAILLRALTGATARRLLRVVGVVGCLIGFVGVIGAMESGSLGLGTGLLIGAVLVSIEFLCLRSYRG